MTIIEADKPDGLKCFGTHLYLSWMQHRRSVAEFADPDTFIVGVDRLVIVTDSEMGRSSVPATILTMPVPAGALDAVTLLEATWAAYVLSVDVTIRADGTPFTRTVIDDDVVAIAARMVDRLGAVATPCDEVYAPEAIFLEGLHLRWDRATRTLTAQPLLAS